MRGGLRGRLHGAQCVISCSTSPVASSWHTVPYLASILATMLRALGTWDAGLLG